MLSKSPSVSVYNSIYCTQRTCNRLRLQFLPPITVLKHEATPLESRAWYRQAAQPSRACPVARAVYALIGRRGTAAVTNCARCWRQRPRNANKAALRTMGLVIAYWHNYPVAACGSLGLLKATRDRSYSHETRAGRKDVRSERLSQIRRL